MLEITLSTGDGTTNHCFLVRRNVRVWEFKELVADDVDVDIMSRVLVCRGKKLKNNVKLVNYCTSGNIIEVSKFREPPKLDRSYLSRRKNNHSSGGYTTQNGFNTPEREEHSESDVSLKEEMEQ